MIKDYDKVLEIAQEFLEIKPHEALPATIEKTGLYAVLENNEIISGEDEIDVPKKHDGNLRIKRIFLNPEVQSYKKALDAIIDSDLITIGPGDLYSSLIPCFLSKGINKALKNSKAKKVFICPPLTKFGETHNYTVIDYTNEIEKYMESGLDIVIYNTEPYNHSLNGAVKIDPRLNPKKFYGYDLIENKEKMEYDSDRLGGILIKLL